MQECARAHAHAHAHVQPPRRRCNGGAVATGELIVAPDPNAHVFCVYVCVKMRHKICNFPVSILINTLWGQFANHSG